MNREELALHKFEEGYNCAQAIACAYAEEIQVDEELIYRFMEGFGGGFAHMGQVCGVLSGLTLIESYLSCKHMDTIGSSKEATYQRIQPLIRTFEQTIGSIHCHEILEHGNQELIHTKKACCRECVEVACRILDNEFALIK